MAMTPDQMQPPGGSDADSAQDADTSDGYTIEIKVSAQGSISVCVEPQAEEDAEEAGGGDGSGGDAAGGDDEDSQPVASIREACKLVTQIYQSQGQLPDNSADQADMAAGYGKD